MNRKIILIDASKVHDGDITRMIRNGIIFMNDPHTAQTVTITMPFLKGILYHLRFW